MTGQTYNPQTYKIALLVSVSCVLQIAESMLPHPVPGLRLGLANIITLIALVELGFKAALEISILRTILSSFILGTFMSPAFILSFSGAVVSTCVMGLLYRLSAFSGKYGLGIVGISVLSALSHNLIQLYLAYLLLVRHKGLFAFLPWLSIGAVVMGYLTGIIAARVCVRIKEDLAIKERPIAVEKEQMVLESRYYSAGNSLIHRLGADKKIIGLFLISLAVIIFPNFWLYLFLSLFLLAISRVSRTPPDFLFLRVKKCSSLVFISFLLPVFFNHDRYTGGLSLGATYALRIIFLVLASSLVIRTTCAESLTEALGKVLSPLGIFGVSKKRLASVLSLSWIALPVFWNTAKDAIRQHGLNKPKNPRRLIIALTEVVAGLYLKCENPVFLKQEKGEV